MPVHVADEEIVHGHVHQVEQSPPLIVRRDVPDHGAVVRVRLPLRLPPLVVAASPRMSPNLWMDLIKSDTNEDPLFNELLGRDAQTDWEWLMR